MRMHSVDLDVATALRTPDECPSCVTGRLVPVCAGETVTFLCVECQGTWSFELGVLVPTDERPDDEEAPT